MIGKIKVTRINTAQIICSLAKFIFILNFCCFFYFKGQWIIPWFPWGFVSLSVLFLLANAIDPNYESHISYYLPGKWKALPLVSEICALLLLYMFLAFYINNSMPKVILLPIHLILGIYFIFCETIIKKLHSYFCKN